MTDLFGIATHAAGAPDPRQGVDVLAMLDGQAKPRDAVFGCIGTPGGRFKLMVRDTRYKYIFMSNGGREQLFDLDEDPHELRNVAPHKPEIVKALRAWAAAYCQGPGAANALEHGDLRSLEFKTTPPRRICQFDASRGVTGFPKRPSELLKHWKA